MELLCPDCLGTLVTTDGQKARCTVHGGEYRILFSRWRPPPPPLAAPGQARLAEGLVGGDGGRQPSQVVESPAGPPVQLIPAVGAMCRQHVNVPAVVACQRCARPMCMTCAFQDSDGTQLCLDCMSQRPHGHRAAPAAAPAAAARAVPEGVRCVQHMHLQATAQCQSCGAFMCSTCAFLLPGGIQVCPACAAAPKTALSARRKKLLVGSYALAGWSTLMMVLVFSGAFVDMTDTEAEVRGLDLLLHFLLLIPSLVGTALGVSTMEKRLGNPPLVWVAACWNGLILGGYLLLCLIGLLSG